MISLLNAAPKLQGWRIYQQQATRDQHHNSGLGILKRESARTTNLQGWIIQHQHIHTRINRGFSLSHFAAMTSGQQEEIVSVVGMEKQTEEISFGDRVLNHIELEPGIQLESEEVVFDKSKFDVWLKLLALRVPKQQSSLVSKILSGYLFDRPRVRHIVPDPSNSSTRLVILSEHITNPSLCELPDKILSSLKSAIEVEVVLHHFLLDYTYWPVEHILKELLPAGCEVPTSFETVGHIAHLNLRDELIPYKKVIAAVLLDKNQPKIKTIVNKVGTISNEFRVPTFETLAGCQSLVTEVKQHGARFRLDYGLVYWNSRLEYEHKRLVSQFSPQQVVCDMFAGIGPFTIPAAQMGCRVYANDLNPDSVKYLQINADINKVNDKVHIFNMDAREFIRQLVLYRAENSLEECLSKEPVTEMGYQECFGRKYEYRDRDVKSPCSHPDNPLSTVAEALQIESKHEKGQSGKRGKQGLQMVWHDMIEVKPWEHVDHVIMNLPASALEFLDVFQGILSKTQWKGSMPRVHCYCFMRSNETTSDVIKRAEEILNGPIKQPVVWTVRDVAPNKTMLCLSFDLPEIVAFGECTSEECVLRETSRTPFVEAAMKRPRMVI